MFCGQTKAMTDNVSVLGSAFWKSPIDVASLLDAVKNIKSGQRSSMEVQSALHVVANLAPTKLVANFETFREVVDLLIATEPGSINALDNQGNTPLHLACSPINGSFSAPLDLLFDIIKYLLEKGADVNVQNNDGNTPLHLFLRDFTGQEVKGQARIQQIKKIIQLLLEKGANEWLENKFKQRPRALINNKNFEFIRFIQEDTPNMPAKALPTTFIVPLASTGSVHDNYSRLNGPAGNFLSKIDASSANVKSEIEKLVELKNLSVIRNPKPPYQTLLHYAAQHSNGSQREINNLKAIIKYAAYPPDVRDADLKTPLHYVVGRRYSKVDLATDKTLEAIEALIVFENDYYPKGVGCDVNAHDKDGNTPLHELALRKDYKENTDSIIAIQKFLVSKGANPSAKNNANQTPGELARATHSDQFPAVLTLGEQMDEAIKKGNIEQANKLFDENKSSLDWEHDVLEGVLSNIVLAYPKDTTDQAKVAAVNSIAEKLIAAGAPESALNKALWNVATSNSDSFAPMVVLFLKKGARPDVAINTWGTILHEAIMRKSPHVALLLEKTPDVNVKDQQGITPLMEAISSRNFDAVKMLLARNPDVMAKNKYNQTMLHVAANRITNDTTSDQDREEYWKLLDVLIEKGADPTVSDTSGRTLETIIKDGPHPEDDEKRLEAIMIAHPPKPSQDDLDLMLKLTTSMQNAQAALTMNMLKIDPKQVPAGASLLHAVAYRFPETNWTYQQFQGIANLLISKDPSSLTKPDHDGKTPLHYACSRDLKYPLVIPMIRYLLKKAKELGVLDQIINAQDKNGQTPLYLFVNQFLHDDEQHVLMISLAGALPAGAIYDRQQHQKRGRLVALLLLANGADPMIKASGWETPVDIAMNKKCFAIARLIQEYTPEIPAKTLPRWLPKDKGLIDFVSGLTHNFFKFSSSVKKALEPENIKKEPGGVKKAIEKLIFTYPQLIRNPKSPHQTLLHYAAWFCNRSDDDIRDLKAIIEYAAYPPDVRDADLKTPIHYAVQKPYDIVDLATNKTLDAIDALLTFNNDYYPKGIGCDVNAQDKDGNTPLHELLQRTDFKENHDSILAIMDFLIKKGADVKIIDKQGNTLLHVVAKRIIALKASGKTDKIQQEKYSEVLERLINKGIDPKIKNGDDDDVFEIIGDPDSTQLTKIYDDYLATTPVIISASHPTALQKQLGILKTKLVEHSQKLTLLANTFGKLKGILSTKP